jgi:WD40 repeat protein/Flp pilus assembly protein TadD
MSSTQISQPKQGFYVIGGTLRRDAQSYVPRLADEKLYKGLNRGHFCYVLTSRQMGKSSLMVRTAARFRDEGVAIAIIDLTAIGQNLSAEQWYDGLLGRIGQQLGLENELDDYWVTRSRIAPLQRVMWALREVVLEQCKSRVIIFIDEIDAVRSLPFSTDEFFAAIRELYNRRTEDHELSRLTFCLLGVATPSDLIRDTRTTPFNIGQRIEVTDFTEPEAARLAQGLGREESLGIRLLQRILYWTGGHPYLTQRLCQAVAEDYSVRNASDVDQVCESMFLSTRARERDDNLLFVRERILRSEADFAGLLELYDKVRQQKHVPDDETNPLLSILRLSGITKVVNGLLRVRNRIYYRAFDKQWVIANMPDAELRRQRAAYRRGILRATGIAGLVLTIMVGLVLTAVGQRNRAEEEKARADRNAQEAQLALAQAQEEARRADKNAQELQVALNEAEQQRSIADKQRQAALQQKTFAEQQTAVALQQRWRAIEQQKIAEEQQRANRKLLYTAQMNLAQQAWESSNMSRVMELLEAQRPKPSEVDLRGFEWHYLWHMSHGYQSSLQLSQLGWPAVLSSDGKLLVIGADENNKESKLVDTGTGRELLTLKPNGEYQDILGISADGGRLLLEDVQSFKVMDISTGRETAVINKKEKAMFFFGALSPDGNQLAITNDGRGLRIIDANSGKELRALNEFKGSFYHIGFSNDGKLIALSDYRNLQVLEIATGRKLFSTTTSEGYCRFRFSPYDKKLALLDYKLVRLFDVETWQEIATLSGHTDDVRTVAFSHDNQRLASASADQTIRLWDLGSKRELATYKGHTGGVQSIAFSQDGRQLISASDDKTVKTWIVGAETDWIALLETHSGDIAVSPDGKTLATAFMGHLQLYDANTGAKLYSSPFDMQVARASPLIRKKQVAFSPDGEKVMVASGGTLRIYGAKAKKELQKIRARIAKTDGQPVPTSPLAFTPDGKYIVAGSDDTTAKLWEVDTGRESMTFNGHSSPVSSVAVSPDGRYAATSSENGEVKLWNKTTGREQATLKGHKKSVDSIAFSFGGRWLATASFDNSAKIWNVETGEETLSLKGHKSAVTSVAFSPDDKRLITVSHDGTLKIWDTSSGQEVFTLKLGEESVDSVIFMPDGKSIAMLVSGCLRLLPTDGSHPKTPISNLALWHLRLANKLASEEKLKAAQVELEKALQLEPTDARYHSQLAEVLSRQRRVAEAERAIRKAVELEPGNADFQAQLAVYLRTQKKYSEAETIYKEAIMLKQNDPEILLGLGSVLITQRKYKEAEDISKEALRLDPDNSAAHNLLGVVLARQYKYEDAEREYRQAIRLNRRAAMAHTNLGSVLSEQGKYQEAEAEYNEALQIQPDFPLALNNLAYHRIERNEKLKESLEMIQKALKAEPTNVAFLHSLGRAYFKLGKLDEAERYLTEAARDTTRSERAQAIIQEHLGDLFHQQGKLDMACSYWEKALSLTGHQQQKAQLEVKLNSVARP